MSETQSEETELLEGIERDVCSFFEENEKCGERRGVCCSPFFPFSSLFPRSVSPLFHSRLSTNPDNPSLSRSTLVQSLQFSALSLPPFVSPARTLFKRPLLRPLFALLLLHSTLFSICAHSLPFQPLRYLPSRFHTLMRTLVRLNDTINSLNEPWNNGIK